MSAARDGPHCLAGRQQVIAGRLKVTRHSKRLLPRLVFSSEEAGLSPSLLFLRHKFNINFERGNKAKIAAIPCLLTETLEKKGSNMQIPAALLAPARPLSIEWCTLSVLCHSIVIAKGQLLLRS